MPTGKRRAVSVQLSIHAPKNTPPAIIRQAIAHKCETGEDTPGIEIRVIDWTGNNGRPVADSDEAFRRLRKPIESAYVRFPPDRPDRA
jgi:hypothetical protein